MNAFRKRSALWTMAACMTGVCLQGCGVASFLGQFNPCGSILECDPIEYRFLTSGYVGPGIAPRIDPACTYPPFCTDDPFVGGAGAGG